jgi:hypothetical protein
MIVNYGPSFQGFITEKTQPAACGPLLLLPPHCCYCQDWLRVAMALPKTSVPLGTNIESIHSKGNAG